ncbi:tail fiber protein [Escherichia phage HY02]|uniref:Putative tail fiber protein n=1 Tax=Escherichia phage HY02 TaxID=1527531 RepID=A0A0H3UDV7_9CAUD|nr:tail fiber protein [Escherichia phage HY02]AIK67888.1 putative tail fiber protein [Escherichia phage HY02]
MADYKLSQLNSIDTIRSEDLLHIRVKKRPEMLGDEDRRMTYQDFLASFKLERFVQIAGSTMTGDLGIVKLLYGGKAVFDPTGSSEITIGDILKTFKINSNGLKLTIADATRSATVYHTLNKPSPNELGMRTNEENDARYARLAVTNNFSIRQAIITDGEQLTLKKATNAGASYIQGRDANNQQTWYVGQGNANSTNVYLYNHATGAMLTLDATAAFNKSLRITGQVQPSDFSNLDARYFTQTVANQRFAQLAANNNFTGTNTFSRNLLIISDSAALRLKNATASSLFIQGVDSQNTNRWYVGNGDNTASVLLHNYVHGSNIRLDNGYISVNQNFRITGQVQPSDWANIDSRYIPAATLNNLAKINAKNTFSQGQIIKVDGEVIRLQGVNDTGGLFLQGYTSDGTKKWFMGTNASGNFTIREMVLGTELSLRENYIQFNKNVTINGQVQPQDWANIDGRYYNKSSADSRYLRVRSTNFNTSNVEKWAKIATVTMRQATSTAVIELFGGSGFNYGAYNQACKTEIVIRAGNNSPKGLNVVAWKNSPNGVVMEIGHVNTSGDNYDIYLKAGPYQNATTARVQSSSNATVQLFETPETSDSAPSGYVAGTIAYYYTSLLKPTPSDIGAYTKAETDQKIADAISDSTDLNKIYPVGIVTWFNSNVNPNTALPGLTWTYLNNGVGRTIRIAAANGSDVATTGGSDSVTLSVGNLPSHTHSFSATTSSFDYGTKTSSTTGNHNHNRGTMEITGSFGYFRSDASSFYTASGAFYLGSQAGSKGYTGNNFTNGIPVNFNASRNWSGVTNTTGNHSHTVGIGAHSHTVSGNTGGTGSGSAFSVTNQFYKLMAWVRTA